MKRTMLKRRTMFLMLAMTTALAFSYEEVRVSRVVPLVDKNASPMILRIDPSGRLWALNTALPSLEQLSDQGRASFLIKAGKKDNALFKKPVDFGFLQDGSLVVADADLDRIAIIQPNGNSDGKDPTWKSPKLRSYFSLPKIAGIAVSQDGVIAVVTDSQNGIDIYSADGILLHHLFSADKEPMKKIVSMAYAKDGTLWVVDGGRGVVYRFSADRRWLGITQGVEGARQVAIDEYGFGYVTLAKGRWAEIAPDGSLSGTFGAKGKNPGAFSDPNGICADQAGNLIVADNGNHRVQAFRVINKNKTSRLQPQPAAYIRVKRNLTIEDRCIQAVAGPHGQILLYKDGKTLVDVYGPDGRVQKSWKKKELQVSKPASLIEDGTGHTWFSDQADGSLKSITENGVILSRIGRKGKEEGALKNPDRFFVRGDGSVVITDRDGSRVQVLGKDGLFLFTVGAQGKKDGQFGRVGAVAANAHLIALLDTDRKALMFFQDTGKFQSEIANRPDKAPIWVQPSDLAADPEGRFYVIDSGAHRVRVFGTHGQFLADFSATGERISCGDGHRVVITNEKSVDVYRVDLVPRAPASLEIKEESGRLQLTWEGNVESSKYKIFRSSDAAHFSFVADTSSATFSDETATPSVLYTYAVGGVNDAGNEGSWAFTKPIKAPKRLDVSLISVDSVKFKPVFTAAYKYYVDHPIGEVILINNDDKIHRNVKISLSAKKYTDFATEKTIEYIGPGEKQAVPVTMTFNDNVLELTENTPVQLEIRVACFDDNQEKTVSQNAPVTLYSRNSINWDDQARLASFITTRDMPVVEYSRAGIRAFLAQLKSSPVPKPISKVALFFESLRALGIAYVPDPTTPYSEVSGNPEALDYVQFPRETLRRKTGDCDDTTALFAALLGSIGVDVALADTPGHVLILVNTEESDPAILGFPTERMVNYQGTYWVPVETTYLNHDFMEAWTEGASRVNNAQEKKKLNIIRFDEAGKKFAPVTLVEKDPNAPAFPEDKVRATFLPILDELAKQRYEFQVKAVKEKIKADPVNHMLVVQLGLVHVECGKPAEARKVFQSLLKEDESVEVRSAALNDLGNLAFLDNDMAEAEKQYAAARQLTPNDGGVIVNQARVAVKNGKPDEAKKLLAEAGKDFSHLKEFASDMPAELLPK